jgi:predicted lactoylglutathione lyase
MLYTQVIPTVTIVATTIFLITALFFPAFIGSALAQAESMNQSMYNTTDSGNQTVQSIGQSANQTGGNSIQQGTNQTGEAIQGMLVM